MPYAKITIAIPESVWISELSRSYPDTAFQVLAATANTATGVARIEIVGEDPASVCEEMRQYDSVTDLTVFEREDDMYRIQVETTVPLLLTSLQDSGVPLEMPFGVQDGEMALEVTVPQQTLSELATTLDRFGIRYTVERIRQEVESESLLTERQHWLLDEAIDRGYYDTPRRTTLVDLADELGISKSTCSGILHRAEGRVLKEYRRSDRERPSGRPLRSSHPL
ncbi:MAG: helix-turn-helix domain-containing protein [Haloarculaceae archaeon]